MSEHPRQAPQAQPGTAYPGPSHPGPTDARAHPSYGPPPQRDNRPALAAVIVTLGFTVLGVLVAYVTSSSAAFGGLVLHTLANSLGPFPIYPRGDSLVVLLACAVVLLAVVFGITRFATGAARSRGAVFLGAWLSCLVGVFVAKVVTLPIYLALILRGLPEGEGGQSIVLSYVVNIGLWPMILGWVVGLAACLTFRAARA